VAPTAAEVWLDWIVVADLKPNTLAAYWTAWRRYLAPALGRRPIDKITYRDYAELARGLKHRPSTCANVLSAARGLHKHAMREEWSTANPAALVDMPASNVRYRPVTLEEGHRVLRAADTCQDRRFGLYVKVLAVTGARRNEVEAIRVDQIAPGGVFQLPGHATKTGKPHFLVIPADVVMELVETGDNRPFLRFARRAGQHRWEKFCAANGFENLHMHDLRRLVAAAATQSMDARTASTLLNHQSRISDSVYSQASIDARIAASQKVAALVSGA